MSGVAVEYWLIAQVIIEILLCVMIVCYLYREKGKRKEMESAAAKVQSMIESLGRLVKESEALEKKHQEAVNLWKEMERKGSRAETRVPPRNRNSAAHSAGKEVSGGPSRNDCYERAARLIERGLSVEDITQRAGLPRGEVELMVNLQRQ